MKALIKELRLPEKSSFLVSSYRISDFDQEWHCHNAYEIIWFIAGSGQAFIGNTACSFQAGDIFMVGINLEHQFLPTANTEIEAMIIQFKDDCWGRDFLQIPECQSIKQLLKIANAGLKLINDTRLQLQTLIQSFETALKAYRISLLLQCLQTVASSDHYIVISVSHDAELKKK